MPFRRHLLVVGNRTIDSPELLAVLRERAQERPIRATLLVATPWPEREAAAQRAERAVAALEEAGVEADVVLGDGDPVVAVQEAWDPRRHDEVVVSTFDPSVSRWLGIDLPHRVERLTGCQVQHVVSASRRPEVRAETVHRERPNLVAGLASLLRARGAA